MRRLQLMLASLSLLCLGFTVACGRLSLPSSGPPPIPNDEPKPAPGRSYLTDPFGGYHGWQTGSTDGGNVQVKNHRMTIGTNRPHTFYTPSLSKYATSGNYDYGISSWLQQGDVDLAFDATVEKDAGAFALYSAACRFQNRGTFYAFLFQSDGFYTIRKFVNEKPTILLDVTQAKDGWIETGLSTNHIHIVCRGDHLQLTAIIIRSLRSPILNLSGAPSPWPVARVMSPVPKFTLRISTSARPLRMTPSRLPFLRALMLLCNLL